MYITIQNTKRRIGFGGLELNDLIFGFPLFFILLLMFSFEGIRFISLILLVISIFMFIPITLSKKNRMYKIIGLVIKFLKKDRKFVYYKDSKKEAISYGILYRFKNEQIH